MAYLTWLLGLCMMKGVATFITTGLLKTVFLWGKYAQMYLYILRIWLLHVRTACKKINTGLSVSLIHL